MQVRRYIRWAILMLILPLNLKAQWTNMPLPTPAAGVLHFAVSGVYSQLVGAAIERYAALYGSNATPAPLVYTVSAFGGSNSVVTNVVTPAVTNTGVGFTNIIAAFTNTYTNIVYVQTNILVTNYFGPFPYQYTDMSGVHSTTGISTYGDIQMALENLIYNTCVGGLGFGTVPPYFVGNFADPWEMVDGNYDEWFSTGPYPTELPYYSVPTAIQHHGALVGTNVAVHLDENNHAMGYGEGAWSGAGVTPEVFPPYNLRTNDYSYLLRTPSNAGSVVYVAAACTNGTDWKITYEGESPWGFSDSTYDPLFGAESRGTFGVPSESFWVIHYSATTTSPVTVTLPVNTKTGDHSGYGSSTLNINVSAEWTPVSTRIVSLSSPMQVVGAASSNAVIELVWTNHHTTYSTPMTYWDADPTHFSYYEWQTRAISRRIYREVINSRYYLLNDAYITVEPNYWRPQSAVQWGPLTNGKSGFYWAGSGATYADAKAAAIANPVEASIGDNLWNLGPCRLMYTYKLSATYYVYAWSIRGAPYIDYGAWLRRETSGSPQFYARLAANPTGAAQWYPSGEPAGLNETYLKMLPGTATTNLIPPSYYGAELNSEMTFPDDVDPEGSGYNAGGWSIDRDATRGCVFWNFKYRQ